jgi:hypothetical protein
MRGFSVVSIKQPRVLVLMPSSLYKEGKSCAFFICHLFPVVKIKRPSGVSLDVGVSVAVLVTFFKWEWFGSNNHLTSPRKTDTDSLPVILVITLEPETPPKRIDVLSVTNLDDRFWLVEPDAIT